MLFCVDTRGFESTRPFPELSIAVSATSRLNAPLTDPSARPIALVGPGPPQLTPIGCAASALRQRALGQQRLQLFALRVAEGFRHHAQLAGESLLVAELAALGFFVGEDAQGRDAHDRAIDEVAQLVRAQDDVERLVPWHVVQ